MRLRFGFGIAFAVLLVSVPREVAFDAFATEIAQTSEEQKLFLRKPAYLLAQLQQDADRIYEQGREQYHKSQYQEAIRLWLQALQLYRQSGNRIQEGYTLANIGFAYGNSGDYNLEVQYQREAISLARQINNRSLEALALYGLGTVTTNAEQSIEYLTQSIKIAREVGEKRTELQALRVLGVAYGQSGRYAEAIEAFQRSLQIAPEIDEIRERGRILSNLGTLYSNLGSLEEALDAHHQSLNIARRVGDRLVEAIELDELAWIYRKLGDTNTSNLYFRQSFAIAREIGDISLQLSIQTALGQNNARQMIEVGARTGNDNLEFYGWMNQGIDYLNSSNYQHALGSLQNALVISKKIIDPESEAAIYRLMGVVWENLGKKELAIVSYKRAINIWETIRANLRELSTQHQQSYLNTVSSTYRHLADLLLQQERVLEAQRVIDLLKVQELDDFLNGVRGSNDSQQGTGYLPPERTVNLAYDQLLDRAVANSKQRAELEDKARNGSELTPAEEKLLDRLLEEKDALFAEFNNFIASADIQTALDQLSRPELRQNVPIEDLSILPDNLKNLQQDAILLYPFILKDRLELVLVSPYGPPIHRSVPVTPEEISQAVGAFRYALEEPHRDAKTPARKLYDWLIAPIEGDLQAAGAKTIVYAPDRTLRYIPLSALYDGEKWLAERFRVNNITAASLTDLNTRPLQRPRILAGAFTEGEHRVTVGDKQFTFSGLAYAGKELEFMTRLTADITPLWNGDFTPQRIKTQADRHTIVHLATHAKFLLEDADDSFIVFGDGDRVTLKDLKQGWLNSLRNVDLVVLSACETGVDNTFESGAEILGFGYLMQRAGARASMASLWAVDDGGTQVLMTEFYDALLRGNLSKAEALRQAQLQLIRAGKDESRGGLVLANADLDPADLGHPHYWAPFILIGNGL